MDYSVLAEQFLKSMYLLNSARHFKKMNDSMRGEVFVLNYLYHKKGSSLPGEISNYMNISTARIAVTLNNLEKKGMITRKIDSSDRRRIVVELTANGEKFAKTMHADMIKKITAVISELGEKDVVEFVRILDKIIEIVTRGNQSELE